MIRRGSRVAAALALTAACAGRGARPHPDTAAAPLELAGEFNIPPLTTFDKLNSARFGGISGIAVDPTTNELLGVSDDRQDSRVFVFRLSGEGRSFQVGLHAYFPLPEAAGAPAALNPEGIAVARDGRLFVLSEGIQNREPRIPPSITIYTRRIDYVGRLPMPSKFVPPETGPITRGVRANTGFESLTLTPDERHLFTGLETSLVQDGDPSTFERGTLVRLLEYEAAGDSFVPAREFAYPVDPIVRPGFPASASNNGLVELLALSSTELLAMERSFAEETGSGGRTHASIRIYRFSLDGATDVSRFESLRAARGLRPVRKRLMLDLADVKGLSPELAGLDNFEGMAFGPALADGSRTLVLVSDDNFSRRQRTSFLLFRINRRFGSELR
jgi:3-phytase/alkaline phosphatase D